MSDQLESHHFFRKGDSVRRLDGRLGTVLDGGTLYALVEWEDELRVEVDQFDPTILVVQRAIGG